MLCDGHIDVLTNGQLGDSALQGVLVTLQPGGQQHDRSLLAQQLAELDGGTAGFRHFDHIAGLYQIGRLSLWRQPFLVKITVVK